MGTIIKIRAWILAVVVSTCCADARADAIALPVYQMIARVNDNGLVVVGTVEEVHEAGLRLRVERTIRGTSAAETLTVAGAWKNGRSEYLMLGAKDRVVLFLNDNRDGAYDHVPRDAWVAVALPGGVTIGSDKKGDGTLQAVATLVAIMDHADAGERHRQMLSAATSNNALLRRQALAYIGDGQLASSLRPEQLKPALIELLGDRSPDARVAALRALRAFPVDDHLELLIRLATSNQFNVVQEAVAVIARYDTPETLQCFMKLLDHDDENFVALGMEGLGASRRPEARAALVKMLESDVSWLRWHACTVLRPWLGRDGSGDLVQAMAELLSDADEQVRWRAALALGAARTADSVRALQQALQTKDTKRVEDGLLRSIHVIYVTGDRSAKAQVKKHLDVIVSLMQRRFDLTSDNASLIIATCEDKTSEAYWKCNLADHPNEQVRRYIDQAFQIRRSMQPE